MPRLGGAEWDTAGLGRFLRGPGSNSEQDHDTLGAYVLLHMHQRILAHISAAMRQRSAA